MSARPPFAGRSPPRPLMQIELELFASFRVGRFKTATWQRPGDTTVGEIIAELEIPEDEIGVILVNAKHVEADRVLVDGDTCSIFPLVGGG